MKDVYGIYFYDSYDSSSVRDVYVNEDDAIYACDWLNAHEIDKDYESVISSMAREDNPSTSESWAKSFIFCYDLDELEVPEGMEAYADTYAENRKYRTMLDECSGNPVDLARLHAHLSARDPKGHWTITKLKLHGDLS